MNQIAMDMQGTYGEFSGQMGEQLANMAAENASMFDNFAEYKEWMGEAFTTQQSGLDEALAVAAAKTEGLNSTQIDLMNTIAEDMQTQYGEFSGGVGGQLEQMAAENASMFDSIEEYQAWMQDSTAEQQAWLTNEFKDQAAAQNNLNTTQSDLMNQIALDMQSQYGDFTSQTGEQLANMAAENASMFDSLEEYQQWMSDNNATAPATPSNPPPSTIADAVKAGKPFGREGDDTWSPDGKNVYHGPGHNWNIPDSENKAPPGTMTPIDWGQIIPAPDGDDGGSSDEAGSASDSNMADAGFSQEDQDFIDSGFDEEDSGGGDSGGGGGGGSYIATASTQALGEEGLSVFNNWRDYMSTWHPTFKTSYGRYRVTAPKIVAEIDKRDNSKELYREIWDKHLKPIYGIIKQDMNDEKALVDYKVMVKELMNKYLKGVK